MNLYRITFDLSDVALGLLVDVSFIAPAKITDDELEITLEATLTNY